MQWFGKGSGNIEDRRGMSGGKAIGGGVGIIVVILGLLFGKDLTGLVEPDAGGQLNRKCRLVVRRMQVVNL